MKKLYIIILLCLVLAFVPSISTFAAYTEDEEEVLKAHSEILLDTTFKDSDKILEMYKIPTAYFIKQNVINGIEKDGELYFEPSTKLTRGQAAKLFAQALGLKETMNVSFTDVLGHWALTDIGKVVKAGIMNGKSPSIFAPDEILTNAEIVSMIARTFKLTERADIQNVGDLHKNHWAYESYSKVVAADIFKMTTKAYPDLQITRGDFVFYLYKAFEYKDELKEQQYTAQIIINKSFDSGRMTYKDTYNVSAYELVLKNDLKVEEAILRISYGNKSRIFKINDNLYSDLQTVVMKHLDSFKSDGLETSVTSSADQTKIYIYSKDHSKQVTIKVISVTTNGVYILNNDLPKNMDFTKGVAPFTITGSGVQHFSVSYNGKTDEVRLDAVFYSKDELFAAINKQLINTGVKIETVGKGSKAKTRFIAQTAIHNMEIVFINKASYQSDFTGYSLPSLNK